MTQNKNESEKNAQEPRSAWESFVSLPSAVHLMICFGFFSIACAFFIDSYQWAKASFPYAAGGALLCMLVSELHTKISKTNAKLDAIQKQLAALAPAQADGAGESQE